MRFEAVRPDFVALGRPAFGTAAQHLPKTPHQTKALIRYRRAARTAAELLPELPDSGSAIHCLMLGSFDLMQVIVAALQLATRIDHLRIATLCFSKRNTAEILSLLESRPDLRFTLLVSDFFKGHNKELFERFSEEIQEHSQARLGTARTHAKVVTFEFGDSDGLVFEGSANLRTNGNREQLTVIRDRGLHDWHAAWIDELVCPDEQSRG